MLSVVDFLILLALVPLMLFGAIFALLSFLMDDHAGSVKWTRPERRRVSYWALPFGALYVVAVQLALPGLIWFLLALHIAMMLGSAWPIHQEHRKLQESTD